ncbi:putative non-specific serine/threonine protein kinase [Helianthus anomalus]
MILWFMFGLQVEVFGSFKTCLFLPSSDADVRLSKHDLILSFRQKVSVMKRLRHPNIVLFMGAVISPHHLRIV